MDMIVWVLLGGAVGWISYRFLRFNEARGLNVSVVIGAAGALIGGKMLTPMFTSAAAADLSVPALVFAATAAAICLFLGNLVYVRWGV
jgi:uncharacterized membrane protein YeaQ/YmgE (transglycosylase-associated protein family)